MRDALSVAGNSSIRTLTRGFVWSIHNYQRYQFTTLVQQRQTNQPGAVARVFMQSIIKQSSQPRLSACALPPSLYTAEESVISSPDSLSLAVFSDSFPHHLLPIFFPILHKKDALNNTADHYASGAVPTTSGRNVPQITFIRTDTTSQEVIRPPVFDGDADHRDDRYLEPVPPSPSHRKSLNPFRRSRAPSESSGTISPTRPRGERRLTHLLHLDRSGSRNSSSSSVNVPSDLPQINCDRGDEQEREAQWEKRATMLAQRSPQAGAPCLSPTSPTGFGLDGAPSRSRSSSRSRINDPEGDVNVQEAIRLHEAGELERSTKMFEHLADPNGANNALSQVLYGLALRHGWGCSPDPDRAVMYLSAAASNSASIESQALQAGIKKGGSAKGELVLAIFELGNCFRNGWGVKKDPVAARQYFETAANLGDTDAMNEVAWCYLEGFGGKKDKFTAAKYYRLAEEKGNKLVGNSWIWKDKYNPH
ncbi:tetratricopeptide repeat protein [Aspergillus neoniger CBS 115656]|uniref:HCP-like protein n=1 Tax=Aspergillus neoniger (strain CBS 115656) TaxID=1448310 RepID=A0A318YU79_ASPNB|nr:HCP-like protein [Aspergillus neoniger CBS 115656]PYH35540.1 HCP-like protein [Aspergillus neoniger CBS 115656]